MYVVSVIIALLCAAGGAVAAITAYRKSSQPKELEQAPIDRAMAIVVDKRSYYSKGFSNTTPQCMVTFELTDGSRAEFDVDSTTYGQIIIGDHGALTWSGETFTSFNRELLR